ncbi:MAG: hypothetical protein QXS24_06590 [Desulfurococcaceae archaeon]
MSEKVLSCPKDGNALSLVYESEKIGNVVKISIYYKCPTCGYRKDLEKLEVQRGEQLLAVKKFTRPPQ